MRRLLTGGIKAILAIAALSTAAHWALRVQREPAAEARAAAAPADPVTTGSIAPRGGDRTSVEATKASGKDGAAGFDQRRLSELIAGTAPEKAKPKRAETAKR
ncbi:hypothetical protein ASG40_01190 [Methylobacterium sp. Leaf399]|uniref:hypothetical protein n=1 Tax=unclassified Methylobacterium TaxID=2615210 RepID=UPI000701A960|nr:MULTISPECIES: hypothetical protein [unclassified Methylobacterium]KQT19488.1 hypothetical protein ASG40_01190 [Methylobacterium sp. Leaf399]KQT78112.1 hypothetical protein ASG59_08920 [Methylobacterium sp. Leaf466]